MEEIVETLSGGSSLEKEDATSTQEPSLTPKEQIRVIVLAKIQLDQEFPEQRSTIRGIALALEDLRENEQALLRMNQSSIYDFKLIFLESEPIKANLA